ncbi:phage tail sheath subtilisin-like domain-containing protein [Acetobacter oeni]|uniref:Tail protein n=1 Tax=Acetobacter oeni TaxID=304077 RepID=A0A511XP74_9PROT|nr:phage tail sheath subtilisin-like domain-containing protein [Acetobacter oeni]MBB3884490.1 phage tail sheath gpL-like [Acetobacter oeni]NHO20422.1 phage tail protein [Acetobacter oeni]GBR00538.1 Mu-like prophage tail sheath protein [Acetobacter oeni LMG 21952]GEN64699.1 tail protein [Acetobacter oeni]
MTISFTNLDTTQRTHGVFAEVDPQYVSGSQLQRTLILGPMLSSGTATANEPFLATGASDVDAACGVSSVPALMYRQYIGQDSSGTVYILPQTEDPTAQAAAGSLLVAGTTTAAGTIALYVAGVKIQIGLSSGTTSTDVATAMAAKINATANLPVTATAQNGTVALTSLNKGMTGNEIDIRLNYLGVAGGEQTPSGITITIAAMAGGATNPTDNLATGLTNLSDMSFDFIVSPYTDSTSLGLLQTLLNDTDGRWSWNEMLYGGYFCAYRGTAGALTTFGNGRDEFTGSCLGFYDSPSPAWLWAADYAGASAVSLRADPGVPLQELILNVLAPPIASRFSRSIRNTLLYDGISTFTISASGQVVIDRAITFWQTDPSGAADITWLNVETPYSLTYVIRDIVAFLKANYGRKKLVADGTNIPGGSNMVTSQTVLAAAVGRYKILCDNGYAQDYDTFKANAAAENKGNGVVALLLPFHLVDQLRMIAIKVNFISGVAS